MTLKTRIARLETESAAGSQEVGLEEALSWGYRHPPTTPEERRAYEDFCR